MDGYSVGIDDRLHGDTRVVYYTAAGHQRCCWCLFTHRVGDRAVSAWVKGSRPQHGLPQHAYIKHWCAACQQVPDIAATIEISKILDVEEALG